MLLISVWFCTLLLKAYLPWHLYTLRYSLHWAHICTDELLCHNAVKVVALGEDEETKKLKQKALIDAAFKQTSKTENSADDNGANGHTEGFEDSADGEYLFCIEVALLSVTNFCVIFSALGSKDPKGHKKKLKSKIGMARVPVLRWQKWNS